MDDGSLLLKAEGLDKFIKNEAGVEAGFISRYTYC